MKTWDVILPALVMRQLNHNLDPSESDLMSDVDIDLPDLEAGFKSSVFFMSIPLLVLMATATNAVY
jgi:hypothetical protein